MIHTDYSEQLVKLPTEELLDTARAVVVQMLSMLKEEDIDWLTNDLQGQIDSGDPEVANNATWSLALLGDAGQWFKKVRARYEELQSEAN